MKKNTFEKAGRSRKIFAFILAGIIHLIILASILGGPEIWMDTFKQLAGEEKTEIPLP